MERQRKFEDQWRDAFRDAEGEPSANLWTNVELDLEKAETGQMKRTLARYRMLAAACIVFTLCVAGLAFYYVSNDREQVRMALEKASRENRSATAPEGPASPTQTPIVDATENRQSTDRSTQQPSVQQDNTQPIAKTQSPDGQLTDRKSTEKVIPRKGNEATPPVEPDKNNNGIAGIAPVQEDPRRANDAGEGFFAIRELGSVHPELSSIRRITFRLPEKPRQDPVAAMLARNEQREAEIRGREKKEHAAEREKLWTSIGFAAGPFSTVASSVSATPSNAYLMSSSTADIADTEAEASGMTYSMGLNLGTRVSDKWVVMGGLNYLTQYSNYTASAAIGTSDYSTFKPASISELEKFSDARTQAENRLINTAPYTVNNEVIYLSLPVQAGYLLVDKQFGVQINTGLATDLFLRNNKSAEGDNIEQIEQGLGDASSPYRSMNVSGLVGTELTYRFAGRYRFALNPGMRYAFSSVYKSDLGIRSTPLTFDVGIRFRYIFE